jgi:hypothetical protein
MNNKLISSLISLLIIISVISCNNKSKDLYGTDVKIDGTGVEMTFMEINDDGDIVVTITNHMESDIKSFHAKAIWLDDKGNTFDSFGGEPNYFPFQQINKNMILSGKKDDFVTMMNIDMGPEGTKSVKIELVSVGFEDKSEWKPKE